MKRYYVETYDTKGCNEIYGPFSSEKEARIIFEELILKIPFNLCHAPAKREADLYCVTVEDYKYCIRLVRA